MSKYYVADNTWMGEVLRVVNGNFVGEINGVSLFVHFDERTKMFHVSDTDTGKIIQRSFYREIAIKKAKRMCVLRIDVIKQGISKHKATHGKLNYDHGRSPQRWIVSSILEANSMNNNK